MEKISEKQNSDNLVDKLIHSSDVKLIFKDVESQLPDSIIDPSWVLISELEKKITDKRNLDEKILSVLKNYSKRKLSSLNRKASASKCEEKKIDRTFLSLKYRIFEACDEYMLSSDYTIPLSDTDISATSSELLSLSIEKISKLKNDYRYSISNEVSIENIIWNLFDECYIAFDECENEK